MKGKTILRILLALAVLPVVGPRFNVYLYTVEENLFLLLILAAVAAVALAFLLAYVCLREGVRFAWQLLKSGFQRTAGFFHGQLARPEVTVRRLPLRH